MIIKVFVKCKILFMETILSARARPHTRAHAHARTLTHARTHARTHAHTHTHARTHAHLHTHARTHTHTHRGTRTHEHADYTKLYICTHKTGSKQRLETDEDSSTIRKTWQLGLQC